MTIQRERVIDELLVARCQQGCQESFELLVRRWHRRFWRYARRLTGSDDDAWDVMQESWIAMLGQMRRLSDPAWFAAWAHRIVRNKCIDHIRSASRQRHLAEELHEQQNGSRTPTHCDLGDAVATALSRLPPDQRELLTLRYGQELNMIEIGVVLGCPVGTVKSRLHHARERLRHLVEGDRS